MAEFSGHKMRSYLAATAAMVFNRRRFILPHFLCAFCRGLFTNPLHPPSLLHHHPPAPMFVFLSVSQTVSGNRVSCDLRRNIPKTSDKVVPVWVEKEEGWNIVPGCAESTLNTE